MLGSVRWLLIAGMFALGWRTSIRFPRKSWRIARAIPIMLGIVLLVLAISGWWRSAETMANFHRWVGQLCLVQASVSLPYSMGVLSQRSLRRRPVWVAFQLLILLLTWGCFLLASQTGYLGPAHVVDQTEESRNRFQILHLYFLPCLTALLLGGCWSFFPPAASKSTSPE